MRILSRYFATRFLGLFAAILFVSTAAIVIVEMLLNFDEMIRDEKGLGGVLTFLFLRVPSYYLRDLVPITVFAAAFFTIGLAAHWLEIIATKAGGISANRASLPILAAATLLAGCSFVFNETVVLGATDAWNRQLRGGGKSISFRRGTFWYHRGDTIYNIESANRAEHTLRGVTLFELGSGGRLERSIQAERALIQSDQHWLLENAIIRSFEPGRRDGAPHVEQVSQTLIEMPDESSSALLEADASTLPLRDLRDYVAARAHEGEPTHRAEALYHSRLSEPFSVVVFALLALPLGLRVEATRSMATPAIYGVATVAAFFTLRNVAATLASEGVAPPALAAWSVIAAFSLFGLWHMRRVTR